MNRTWSKRWRRGTVKAKCKYCGEDFLQEKPWQEYCRPSHRVLASRERASKRLRGT